VASDAEGDVDVQMGPPPASEGMANGVEEAEVLEELGMDVDVGDVEASVPAKATTTPAKRASPTKPAPKSQSTPTAKPKPAPKSKPTPKAYQARRRGYRA
jgi:outer membrane biosynthesis protein TonB